MSMKPSKPAGPVATAVVGTFLYGSLALVFLSFAVFALAAIGINPFHVNP